MENIHGSQDSVFLGSSLISVGQAQASSAVFCFENEFIRGGRWEADQVQMLWH